MTKTAVYSFVSNKQIPKKKEGMQVFYSKTHVDVEKGLINKSDTYYTVQEATTKFNITRDALYSYIKYHNIPKIKEGKYIKISKPHLDRLFESPIIS